MGSKYTEAQKRASIKYLKESTDSVQIRVKKGTKDRWKAAAADQGKSLNQFITDCIEKEITNDSFNAVLTVNSQRLNEIEQSVSEKYDKTISHEENMEKFIKEYIIKK